jgi:hypothetical protein
MTGTETAEQAPPRPAVLDWVLVILLCLLSAVVAVYGVFFLPAYIGSVPMPAVVVVTAAALVALPRMSYRLTRSMAAALAPAAVWFLVSVGLYLTTNALYRGVPVAWRGWQFYLLIGIGAIAAATSLGLLWSEQLEQQLNTRLGPDLRRR